MDYRLIAIFVIIGFAFAEAGCASKSERGEEVLFQAQTGSRIQRRGTIERNEPRKPKKEKTKKKATPKPPRETTERSTRPQTETELEAPSPSPTPPETTPTPPEKFR